MGCLHVCEKYKNAVLFHRMMYLYLRTLENYMGDLSCGLLRRDITVIILEGEFWNFGTNCSNSNISETQEVKHLHECTEMRESILNPKFML